MPAAFCYHCHVQRSAKLLQIAPTLYMLQVYACRTDVFRSAREPHFNMCWSRYPAPCGDRFVSIDESRGA
jgi:hypothetical protein